MNVKNFLNLYDLLEIKLKKNSRRQPLPPALRLAAVLCLMANGSDVAGTVWHFRISKQVLYTMIPEVCTAICEVLTPLYIQFPNNEQKWKEIANGYWSKWQFPNCIGAIDGKDIEIISSIHSGSCFFNYKKFNSFVLLAVCGSDNIFNWYNIGDYGSCSDSSIFTYTDLHRKMTMNELHIPVNEALPNTDVQLPYAFIGDNIFSLGNHLLKGYSQSHNMSLSQKIFNYRLKRARMTIECSFGILSSKFQILRQSLKFELETSKKIVAASIALHNFILYSRLQRNINENVNDANNIVDNNPVLGRISAHTQRDILRQYFVSPIGALEWQEQYI